MSNQYNDYITSHRQNVVEAFKWLCDHHLVSDDDCPNIILHDASKWSFEEYGPYDKYFYGNKTDEVKKEFDYAWLHHIHNNPHHWQYWVLISDEEGVKALEMPINYVIEMLCDWWSFSFKKGDLKEIFNWYDKHKGTMTLHSNTKAYVEDLLAKIRDILDKEVYSNA